MRARLFKSCSRKQFLTREGAESMGMKSFWCDNCRFWHRISPSRPRKAPTSQLEFQFPQDIQPQIQKL
jgi:hypothetical protein